MQQHLLADLWGYIISGDAQIKIFFRLYWIFEEYFKVDYKSPQARNIVSTHLLKANQLQLLPLF